MAFARRVEFVGNQAGRTPDGVGSLNRVVAYWHACIQQEDTLGQGISPLARKRSVLNPFPRDPFIFTDGQHGIKVPAAGLSEFFTYASAQELDCYFGYPLLLFRNRENKA